MTDIVDSVRRVTDILGEISSASQEQSAGIEQVNQAITQMDQMTQQNAALVEEAAAARRRIEPGVDCSDRLTGGRLVMDLNSGRTTVDGRSTGGAGTSPAGLPGPAGGAR